MITLRDNYERLTDMLDTLLAAQNLPHPPPPQTLLQRIMISEIVSTLIFVTLVSTLQHHMPPGFPWAMPHNFVPEGYQPDVEVLMA